VGMNKYHHDVKRKILVLEDDVLLAMDMEDHLLDSGYEVIGPFANVSEALGAIEETSVDGAVVDLNLNGEMSFPVIEALKVRGLPVIVCSGYAELPEFKNRLSNVPLLSKPCDPKKLVALLSESQSAKQGTS
jgi:DNA-binding NtrC family response regulator